MAGIELKLGEQNGFVTIVFDNEEDYVRFTDYAFDKFGGDGLELTNLPIATSLRARRSLLYKARQVQPPFAMHLVTDEDIRIVRERNKGRKPFDPKNLEGFHIPGIPRLR